MCFPHSSSCDVSKNENDVAVVLRRVPVAKVANHAKLTRVQSTANVRDECYTVDVPMVTGISIKSTVVSNTTIWLGL